MCKRDGTRGAERDTLTYFLSMCIYDYITIQINPSMTPAFRARLNYTYVGEFQRDGKEEKNVHRFGAILSSRFKTFLQYISNTGLEREYKFYERINKSLDMCNTLKRK